MTDNGKSVRNVALARVTNAVKLRRTGGKDKMSLYVHAQMSTAHAREWELTGTDDGDCVQVWYHQCFWVSLADIAKLIFEKGE